MSTSGSRSTRSRQRTAGDIETSNPQLQPTPSRGSTHVSASEPTETTAPELEHAEEPQLNPDRINLTHHEGLPPTTTQRLEALRRWRQQALDEQELRQLEEIKRRFDQGDIAALTEELQNTVRANEVQQELNTSAPRLEKLTQFTNRDRAEFNH